MIAEIPIDNMGSVDTDFSINFITTYPQSHITHKDFFMDCNLALDEDISLSVDHNALSEKNQCPHFDRLFD